MIGGERHAIGRLLTGSQAGSFNVAVGPAATATGRDAPVVNQEGETGQQEYLARFTLTEAARLDALEIALVESTASAKLAVQAVTLVDERTETFVPLLPSDRGRFRRVHSGDVKIYERLGGSGRAQLIGTVRPAASLDEAVRMLRVSDVMNASQASAVVETSAEAVAAWGLVDRSNAPSGSEVAVISYEPERIVVHARSERPSFLLLKDAYYPGWQAAVNGEPVEVVATNVLFRGVPVPAGESKVIFSYRPTTWRTGLRLSLAGGLLWLLMAALTYGHAWRRNS